MQKKKLLAYNKRKKLASLKYINKCSKQRWAGVIFWIFAALAFLERHLLNDICHQHRTNVTTHATIFPWDEQFLCASQRKTCPEIIKLQPCATWAYTALTSDQTIVSPCSHIYFFTFNRIWELESITSQFVRSTRELWWLTNDAFGRKKLLLLLHHVVIVTHALDCSTS